MADYAYIKLKVDTISLIESDTLEFTLDELQREASCDTISIVHCGHAVIPTAPALRSELLMCIDDNGKILGKEVNYVASLLYGNPNDCIVGDVVLGWTDPLDDVEPDIYKMPYKLAASLFGTLQKAYADMFDE